MIRLLLKPKKPIGKTLMDLEIIKTIKSRKEMERRKTSAIELDDTLQPNDRWRITLRDCHTSYWRTLDPEATSSPCHGQAALPWLSHLAANSQPASCRSTAVRVSVPHCERKIGEDLAGAASASRNLSCGLNLA